MVRAGAFGRPPRAATVTLSGRVQMDIAVPRPGTGEVSVVPEVRVTDPSALAIRSATVQDVHGMSALINEFASSKVMLARGPQYLYEHIRDYIVVTAPRADGRGEAVVACGASHVLWEDLAELRSVAVHPICQQSGLGRRIVEELMQRCRAVGIHRAFVFTLAVPFFTACGFTQVNRDDIPRIVWVECSRCPKFYRCDEVGMMRKL